MKKIISIILSFSFIFTFVSCSNSVDKKRDTTKFSKSFVDLFDTASTITAYDESQKKFNEHFDMVYNELLTYSKLFDIYNTYDDVVNLKYVNENASKAPVKVDKKIIDLLLYGKESYKISNGYTNICMGSVLKLWHDKREEGLDNPQIASLPDMNELKEKALHTNIDNLIIDEENSTVFFKDDKMLLDVGAITKGYVCEKIADFIKKNNIWQSVTISLGGNIKAIGFKNNDGKTPFIIGVENPNSSENYYAKIKTKEGDSVVTSGDYQRFYTVNGKDYCHIISPNSLMPANEFTSVSVVTKDSALGDTLSTALFIMDLESGKKLVESLDGVEALWVDKDGKMTKSSNFESLEVK